MYLWVIMRMQKRCSSKQLWNLCFCSEDLCSSSLCDADQRPLHKEISTCPMAAASWWRPTRENVFVPPEPLTVVTDTRGQVWWQGGMSVDTKNFEPTQFVGTNLILSIEIKHPKPQQASEEYVHSKVHVIVVSSRTPNVLGSASLLGLLAKIKV